MSRNPDLDMDLDRNPGRDLDGNPDMDMGMEVEPAEMEEAVLELLCMDGFLESSELCEADFPGASLWLLKRAVKRGFQIRGTCKDSLSEPARIFIKRSDSLRIWKDLVRHKKYLRAPPCAFDGRVRYGF